MSTFGKLTLGPSATYVSRCERCGATPYGTGSLCKGCRRRSLFKTAAVVFIVAEGIFLLSLMGRPNVGLTLESSRTAGFTSAPFGATPFNPAPASAPSSAWKSVDTPSAVPGHTVRHARLLSASARSSVEDPSLVGVTTGTLDIVKNGKDGKSVTISFAQVQESCDAGQCSVRASFDETNPQNYAFTDLSDAQHTVLKLNDYDSFTQHLSVSNDLTVIASLGNGHPSVLRFTVAGYDTAALVQHLTIKLAALPPQAGRPYPG